MTTLLPVILFVIVTALVILGIDWLVRHKIWRDG